MLVICEDCAKKYTIDETQIKGERARFPCRECGHIIVAQKPSFKVKGNLQEAAVMEDKNSTETKTAEDSTRAARKQTMTKPARKKGKGVPIGMYLFLAPAAGLLLILATVGYLYHQNIPQLINQQVNLRTAAIATSFSGAITQPLLAGNYLQVNKEAERVSRLPGVAYASVVNQQGIIVAGFFSDLDRFSSDFSAEVKKKGFPESIIQQNTLSPGITDKDARIEVGNQKIQDRVAALHETGGEVHVGIFISEIDQAINDVLFSTRSLSLVGLILACIFLIFFLIARFISKPLQELTNVVDRISLGELDLSVQANGPREIRELASAFERMRFSIKTAMERMRKMS